MSLLNPTDMLECEAGLAVVRYPSFKEVCATIQHGRFHEGELRNTYYRRTAVSNIGLTYGIRNIVNLGYPQLRHEYVC